jgi:hypothetical protein
VYNVAPCLVDLKQEGFEYNSDNVSVVVMWGIDGHRYGDFGQMFEKMLREAPEEQWDLWYPVDGKWPPPEQFASYQAGHPKYSLALWALAYESTLYIVESCSIAISNRSFAEHNPTQPSNLQPQQDHACG